MIYELIMASEWFTAREIEDALRTIGVFSENDTLEYRVSECKKTDNIHILSVKNNGLEGQYVLVKVLSEASSLQQTISSSSLIWPVFTLTDTRKGVFMVFNKRQLAGFDVPEKDNIQHLKAILKTLANLQASNLVKNENVSSCKISKAALSLDYFKRFDKTKLEETLENLQTIFDNQLLKTSLLVQSIWSPNNAYYGNHNALFLGVASQKTVPPTFDALLYIFALSTEAFRQQHFEDLILYYLTSLKSALAIKNPDENIIGRPYIESQVRALLPLIKFELVDETKDSELFDNIANYLKYPLINQEDVYEVLRNYLGSTDYKMLDYKLVPLVENNGHLGEYFYLDIKVLYQNQEQDVRVFAKFLVTHVEFLKQMLETGPGKKEDFFYKVLYPLYVEHGLESLLNFAPKCYLSRYSWLIVLDDLSKMDFVGLKPNAELNYGGLKATIEKLAKFHAATLILEETLSLKANKQVRLHDDYAEYFEETFLLYDESSFTKPMFDASLACLEFIVGKCPDIVDKLNISPEELKEGLKNIFMQIFRQTKDSCRLRNVVNHGDLYVANMLFNIEADKTTVKDAILIDFQLLRYIPPAFEVLFFIFSSSTKETRSLYLQKLLEDYYDNITSHIKNFGFDPDEIFPKDLFEENVKFAKPAALSMAFNYDHVIHIDPDFREEILHDTEKTKYYLEEHQEELVNMFWDNDRYRNSMRGLVEDFVDFIRDGIV